MMTSLLTAAVAVVLCMMAMLCSASVPMCTDVRTDCATSRNKCSEKRTKEECRKTCRECTDEETEQMGTRDDTTTTAATCTDFYDDCSRLRNRCSDPLMQVACRRTCSNCSVVMETDDAWGRWSGWSQCSATCGSGTRSKERTCSLSSYAACEGPDKETKDCTNLPKCCVPRDGQWTNWAAGLACSVSCGGGYQTWRRTCTGQNSCGRPCEGYNVQTRLCNDHGCPHFAVLGTCNVSTRSGTWKIIGYCDIKEVFESTNQYDCSWSYTNPMERIQSSLQLSPIHPNRTLLRGNCSFEANIPKDFSRQSGTKRQLSYWINVQPGNSRKDTSVSVAYPVTPTLTCPAGAIPDGSQLQCTCSTSDPGDPAGRLLLFFEDVLVQTGSYGQNFLHFSRGLSRADDGATVSCFLEWEKNIKAYTNHTVQLLKPPTVPTFTIWDQKVNHTVDVDNRTVRFTCNVPSENVQFLEIVKVTINGTQQKKICDPWRTSVSYDINIATCEDAGMYYCLARNEMGQTNSTPVQLNVLCSPRLVTMTTTNRIEVTQGSDCLFKFEVVAYPDPTMDSFTFFKRDDLSSLNPEPVRSGLLSVGCERHAVDLYLAICSVNVTDATVSDTGIYYFKVRNQEGNVNVTFELHLPAQDSSGQDNSLSFIGLAIAVLVLAFIAACIAFIIKRRKAPPGVNAEEPTCCNVTTQSVTSACASDNNIYMNLEKNTSTKDSNEPGTSKGPDEGTQNVLYAAVDKSRKPSSHNTEKPAKPAVMPKPMRKGAAGRKPQENGGDGLSATATGKTQAGGVENVVNNNEAGSSDSKKATANQEGLFYTEADFSQYRPETQRPLPQQEETFYAAVVLQKTAALRT